MTTLFQTAIQALQLVTWPALLYYAIKFSIKGTRLFDGIEHRASRLESDISVMKDNHLQHIQQATEETNVNMKLMQSTLANIDRNIQRLADK